MQNKDKDLCENICSAVDDSSCINFRMNIKFGRLFPSCSKKHVGGDRLKNDM